MQHVFYLEKDDITSNGSIKPYVTNGKPVVLMVQGLFCGFCVKASPAFEKAASINKEIVFCSVKIDGADTEKAAASIITKLDKSYKGVPTYYSFDRKGNYVTTHTGGRDVDSITKFANSI